MNTKVWNLMYVAGNPAMFTRVTANADNPMKRAEALCRCRSSGPQWLARMGGAPRDWQEDFRERAGASAPRDPQCYR